MVERARVVIVGGGIAGLACAFELARRGIRPVIVVERRYPGSGASGRNLARLRTMQLTEDLTLLARRCRGKYEQLGDLLGFNVLYYLLDYVWLLYEDAELEVMQDAAAMHARLGVPSRLLDPEQLLREMPELRGGEPNVGGLVNREAMVHHDAVIWAYLERARKLGVVVWDNTDVTSVEIVAGAVAGVTTTRGSVSADVVVNAAGGWSGALSRLAGLARPNTPLRREVLVTAPVTPFLSKAATFYRPAEGWIGQTLRGEVVMGVTDPAEPSGVNQRSSLDFLIRTARVMTAKMPVLANLTVIRQWAGMYDVTPDHLPLVGADPELPGFHHLNGWSGRGMLLAPLLAELAAEIIAGSPPDPLLERFAPGRFEGSGDEAALEQDYYSRYARREA